MNAKKIVFLTIVFFLVAFNAYGAYAIVSLCSPLPSDASFIGTSVGFVTYVFCRVVVV